jgi:glycosyltransferase involved in cell wall biosynthesis
LAKEPGVIPMLPFPLTANRHLAASPLFHGLALGGGRRIPGLRWLMRPINRRAVAAALARGGADILHATWYDATLVDRAVDIPVVLTIHDMLPELMPEAIVRTDAAPHGDKLALLHRAHRVVAVSAATAADLCRLTGLSGDAVRVIHQGVSSSLRWHPSHGRPPGLPDQYLLFVGQRAGYKNFVGVAPSLAQLLRRNSQLRIVCAGGGPLQAEELGPFARLGVAQRVRQIEADDRHLAACYAHAAVFVFPSLHEGFGLPLLEAMMNGCPVISSNRGALPEIGADAAIYFDPAEPDQLVDLVEALDRDRPRAAALAARGLSRAADFSWRRTADAHAALYRELL